MSGFTVTNGATRSAGDVNLEQSGGGVWCESASVFVSNCVFTVNYAPQNGGGASGGTFDNCVFTNNSAGNGSGAVQCTLNNCSLISNSGCGAASCVVSNCFFDDNGGNAEGGGLDGCTVFRSEEHTSELQSLT